MQNFTTVQKISSDLTVEKVQTAVNQICIVPNLAHNTGGGSGSYWNEWEEEYESEVPYGYELQDYWDAWYGWCSDAFYCIDPQTGSDGVAYWLEYEEDYGFWNSEHEIFFCMISVPTVSSVVIGRLTVLC